MFDFPEVQDINTVPESFRSVYAKDESGVFKVDSAHKAIVDAYRGTHEALVKERKSKPSPVDLSPLKEYGESPADIAKKFSEILSSKPAAEEVAKPLQKKITELEHVANTYKSRFESHQIDNEILAASNELKGVPEILGPLVKSRLKVIDDAGVSRVVVLGDNGEVQFNINQRPKGVKELMAELKTDPKFARLFDAETRTTGADPAPGKTNTTLSSIDRFNKGLNAR